MADMSYMPYAQRAAEIERQRKLAELLQQQYAEPIQQQTVGGFVVPTSPWQTVAKLAQAGLGAYMQNKSDKAAAELDKQQRAEAKKSIQDFMAASGPQRTVTQTPVMEQDFGQAATPEDYQNMINDPQMGLAPKRRNISQAATPEDVQDIVNQPYVTKDITSYTPGLSRNEQIAKLLEMQAGDNKYVASAVPTLTGLLSKSPEVGAVNPADWTPASLAKYASTGDYNDLVPKVTAEKPAALPSAVQEYEYAVRQGFKGTLADYERQKAINVNVPAAETYGGLTPVIDPKTGQTIYVRPGSKGSIQEVSEYKPPAAQAPEAFHEKNLDLENASGNFSNFRNVLNTINKAGGIYGESAGQLASAFKLAQNSIRKLQGTGVLNIGELPFLEQALSDPQGFMSLADPTSRQKILGQLDQLDKALQRQKQSLYAEYKQPLAQDKTSTASPSGETAAQRAKRLGL